MQTHFQNEMKFTHKIEFLQDSNLTRDWTLCNFILVIDQLIQKTACRFDKKRIKKIFATIL